MEVDNKRMFNSQLENKALQPGEGDLYANLSKALIEHCRHDGGEASEILSVKLANINSQLNSLKIKIDEGMDAESMASNVQIAMSEVVQAFMQLQFFDRVSQRLEHASASIDFSQEPALAVNDPIDAKFTMEDERVLYEALLDGEDVNGAVQKATSKLDNTLDKSDGDDIELF